MTCKDCIHFEVCEAKDTEFTGLPFSIANDNCSACPYFKDKLLFAKLPCKVGETLYCISYNDNIQFFVKEYKNISLVNILTLMTALENPASRIVLLTGNKKEAETKLSSLRKETHLWKKN